MMATRLHIAGLVQGVGYRAAFASKAQEFGLSGWVRNRRDGSVEALVNGDAAAVKNLTEWAHRGPAGARVARVEVSEVREPSQPPVQPGSFDILPTS